MWKVCNIFVVLNFVIATSPGAWHCCTSDDVITPRACARGKVIGCVVVVVVVVSTKIAISQDVDI